jgi:hypothetical protein
LDKTLTNAYYEIEIDPETVRPVKISLVVLTGKRGDTVTKGQKIVGGQHVAFHFDYALSGFDEGSPPTIPPEASRLLTKN